MSSDKVVNLSIGSNSEHTHTYQLRFAHLQYAEQFQSCLCRCHRFSQSIITCRIHNSIKIQSVGKRNFLYWSTTILPGMTLLILNQLIMGEMRVAMAVYYSSRVCNCRTQSLAALCVTIMCAGKCVHGGC